MDTSRARLLCTCLSHRRLARDQPRQQQLAKPWRCRVGKRGANLAERVAHLEVGVASTNDDATDARDHKKLNDRHPMWLGSPITHMCRTIASEPLILVYMRAKGVGCTLGRCEGARNCAWRV